MRALALFSSVAALLGGAAQTNYSAATPGDAGVKQKLYGLLGRAQLRRFFAMAVDHGNLGRIRGLFGAPPYFFVGAGEGLLLRAGGFAARTHMAGASPIPNFSQMVPQFVDQHERGLSLADDELFEWPEPRSGESEALKTSHNTD